MKEPHRHHTIKHIGVVALAFTIAFTLLRGAPFVLPTQSAPHAPFLIPDPNHLKLPRHTSPMTVTHATCHCHVSISHKKRDSCCHRRIIGVHKGGHVLVSQFREKFFPKVHSVFVRSNSTQTRDLLYEDNETTDYRDVFIARDLYEMVISGYLYHKSGRECWLDMYGRPLLDKENQDNTLMNGWEDLLGNPSSFPSVNHRSLCRYLEQESLEAGIRVYTEYAIQRWYRPFFDIIDRRTAQQDYSSRTLFLDLHQLDDERQTLVVPMLQEFLVLPKTTLVSPDNATNNSMRTTIHDHGHDTSHDPDLRLQLKNLIRQVDDTCLNGWIEQKHQWPPLLPPAS